MDIFRLGEEAERLRGTKGEIAHRKLVERPGYRAGLAIFRKQAARPKASEKPKEITHPDLVVLAHVIRGSGVLTVRGESRGLVPGMVLHLPAGTPHDFAAGREDLVLLYALIRSEGQ